jgi:hypothetical protein
MRGFTLFTFMATAILAAVTVAPAAAQRGMGEPSGVARGGAVDVGGLAGEITDTKVGACANTTGRAVEGAHLLVALPDGQDAEVHLGPTTADVVGRILDAAEPGAEVAAEVFRTDAMPFGTFAAVTVTIGDETWRLRDDGLRPSWAAGAQRGRGAGAGAGAGPGRGGAGGGAGAAGGGGAGPAAGGRCWWDLPRDG